jgi:hypothetical protein
MALEHYIESHYRIAEHLEYAVSHNKKAAQAYEKGLYDLALKHAQTASSHYFFIQDLFKTVAVDGGSSLEEFNRDILSAFGTQRKSETVN